MGDEDTAHKAWKKLPQGTHTINLALSESISGGVVLHLGTLNYAPEGIFPPQRATLYGSSDGENYTLLAVTQPYAWPNNRHDAWVQEILLGTQNKTLRHFRVVLTCPSKCYIDELGVSF